MGLLQRNLMWVRSDEGVHEDYRLVVRYGWYMMVMLELTAGVASTQSHPRRSLPRECISCSIEDSGVVMLPPSVPGGNHQSKLGEGAIGPGSYTLALFLYASDLEAIATS